MRAFGDGEHGKFLDLLSSGGLAQSAFSWHKLALRRGQARVGSMCSVRRSHDSRKLVDNRKEFTFGTS